MLLGGAPPRAPRPGDIRPDARSWVHLHLPAGAAHRCGRRHCGTEEQQIEIESFWRASGGNSSPEEKWRVLCCCGTTAFDSASAASHSSPFPRIPLPSSPALACAAWDDSVDWEGIVRELVLLFPLVPRSSSRFWSTLLLNKLAALRKHDVKDRGGWDAHNAAIFTQITARFELPIGNAQGAPPFVRAVPQECTILFHFELFGRPTSPAKLIVYGLRNGEGTGTAAGARMLMDVLEHHSHPSNDGPWTAVLGPFLRGLTKHLLKRKAAEGRGILGAGAWGGPLGEEATDAFSADVSRLVARAQFSKRSDLARTAVAAAAGFSFIAPRRLLPLVVARFEAALEALTATHQLVAAIETLSACVRPLLCAPADLVDPFGEGPAESRLSAPPAALLAAALQAVIPGIDANDPPKTLATLRFFVSALSNLGVLADDDDDGVPPAAAGLQLPIAWGEWADAVLARIFALLENCDPGAQRVD